MKKKILYTIITGLCLLGVAFVYGSFWPFSKQDDLPPAENYQAFTNQVPMAVVDNTTSTDVKVVNNIVNNTKPVVDKPVVVRNEINLNVPFTSQAPTANWDEPFQNACEEASLMMVYYYYENKKMPDKLAVEKILIDMVAWEVQTWGVHPELPVAKEAALGLAMYNQPMEIINDLTVEKIKDLLRQGRPVIVPADGKKLANPNFRNGGPPYHMLVIKGFVGDKFITNDPGTRLGADFIYTQSNLMSAIADWDESDYAAVGSKVGLVFALR